MKDTIDIIISQWAHERPELDARPMAFVGRILRLAELLEDRVEKTLKPFNLSLWQFDVLATLRRFGKPYQMSPKQLMQEVMLSSGAMTNRIDRLEDKGFVKRRPDPNDRRGVIIELTAKGRRLVNRAISARLDEAREVTELLSIQDVSKVNNSLRVVLLALQAEHQ